MSGSGEQDQRTWRWVRPHMETYVMNPIFPLISELSENDEDLGYSTEETGADEVVRGILCAVSSRPSRRLV